MDDLTLANEKIKTLELEMENYKNTLLEKDKQIELIRNVNNSTLLNTPFTKSEVEEDEVLNINELTKLLIGGN